MPGKEEFLNQMEAEFLENQQAEKDRAKELKMLAKIPQKQNQEIDNYEFSESIK